MLNLNFAAVPNLRSAANGRPEIVEEVQGAYCPNSQHRHLPGRFQCHGGRESLTLEMRWKVTQLSINSRENHQHLALGSSMFIISLHASSNIRCLGASLITYLAFQDAPIYKIDLHLKSFNSTEDFRKKTLKPQTKAKALNAYLWFRSLFEFKLLVAVVAAEQEL